jgi:proton-dependent oligopeptide transporter, POT family
VNLGGFLAPLVCGTLAELYGWHVGFAAAGVGMLIGLTVYVFGGAHLKAPEQARSTPITAAASHRPNAVATFILLLGIGIAVTVFRGAYEQIGNTVALWSDVGITRQVGSLVIPATWFQSLNPLLVFIMTPALLGYWRKRADKGLEPPATRRMALGALIVALSYVLLAGVAATKGAERANGLWLVLYFVIFTFGELHILPTGLGLFARLAPEKLAATTVAGWFLATFSGSLCAGIIGTLWSSMSNAMFFGLLALVAAVAAAMLLALGRFEARN